MKTDRKIVGLKADYGSLDLRIEDRTAFIDDAQRVLREIGEVLKAEGTIQDFSVRQQASRVLGYAGEIAGNYFEPKKQFAVSLVFTHTEDEVKTRPDGVGGYALYRHVKNGSLDPKPAPEDRRALYGTYPEALLKLVRTMLADHKDRKKLEKAC